LARGEWHRRFAGQPFPYFLPAFHPANVFVAPTRRNGRAAALRAGAGKEQPMDAVYVLLGLAFFLISYVIVEGIGRL